MYAPQALRKADRLKFITTLSLLELKVSSEGKILSVLTELSVSTFIILLHETIRFDKM
jgi:hypothetical protein